nr:hypothetical protein [Dyella sp. ASV24]
MSETYEDRRDFLPELLRSEVFDHRYNADWFSGTRGMRGLPPLLLAIVNLVVCAALIAYICVARHQSTYWLNGTATTVTPGVLSITVTGCVAAHAAETDSAIVETSQGGRNQVSVFHLQCIDAVGLSQMRVEWPQQSPLPTGPLRVGIRLSTPLLAFLTPGMAPSKRVEGKS